MSAIRCFVAAELPGEVREDLRRLQDRLRRRNVDVRWLRPESMHLTVRFLGELEPDLYEAIVGVLREPLAGQPCKLRGCGLGTFPGRGRARVLWVGLGGDTPQLARAALEVEARLESVGVPRDLRPFRPHLTLARARGPSGMRGLASALEQDRDYEGPSFDVGSLTLFESRLRPGGAEHIPRLRTPLGGAL